ncbi:MAG: 23S rRNA (uracil(1939)-C(5))-methyltransferase RlmD [Gammaproteobacteria bacterium]|nr:23S rRNA (uracil(1939)-C(5))-methyltransferase RlmD [Gammaproteobacteria bacterium]
MSRRNFKPVPAGTFPAVIGSLSHDGRGVAHIEGKTIFIEGALPGEEVMFKYLARHRHFDEGVSVEIKLPSPQRVAPQCKHFEICGGCSLQHLDAHDQILVKQKILLENFRRIGKVEPTEVLVPLTGDVWGYRRKARLGCKYVIKKQKMVIGFREKRSAFLADLETCEVLHPAIGQRLDELRVLVHSLKIFDRIPQIELAVSDTATALVFRHLDALIEDDLAKLCDFGVKTGFHIYLQPKGPDSVHLLWPDHSELSYRLSEFDLELFFRPTDFTQVNYSINPAMVSRAIQLLDIQPQDRVLDLFCGLGNFTLPLTRHARHVVGVEGDELLVKQGRENARRNGLVNVEFHGANLTLAPHAQPWFGQGFDKILLDPPRTGAYEIVQHIAEFGAKKIVYVACDPATLARDAGVLVNEAGYRLVSAGVMDMFPHTTHVESIALFER